MPDKIKKSSRAYLAGVALTKALVEMVNLMYQENTAKNFLSGVLSEFGKCHRYFKNRVGTLEGDFKTSTNTESLK